jgi:hypothetical protein
LTNLAHTQVATPAEVLALIDRHGLQGHAIGYVDAQLLTATVITPEARLWTHDRRLSAAASHLGCAADADIDNGPPR